MEEFESMSNPEQQLEENSLEKQLAKHMDGGCKESMDMLQELNSVNQMRAKIDKMFIKATAQILQNKGSKGSNGSVVNELRYSILRDVLNTEDRDELMTRLKQPNSGMSSTLQEIK